MTHTSSLDRRISGMADRRRSWRRGGRRPGDHPGSEVSTVVRCATCSAPSSHLGSCEDGLWQPIDILGVDAFRTEL